MASILGRVRSFLTAFPPLRCFTDLMIHFIKTYQNISWDRLFPLPPQIPLEVSQLLNLMSTWKGRILDGQIPVKFLHSDSSDTVWAGLNLQTKEYVQ